MENEELGPRKVRRVKFDFPVSENDVRTWSLRALDLYPKLLRWPGASVATQIEGTSDDLDLVTIATIHALRHRECPCLNRGTNGWVEHESLTPGLSLFTHECSPVLGFDARVRHERWASILLDVADNPLHPTAARFKVPDLRLAHTPAAVRDLPLP
jgi:hypothetical protein